MDWLSPIPGRSGYILGGRWIRLKDLADIVGEVSVDTIRNNLPEAIAEIGRQIAYVDLAAVAGRLEQARGVATDGKKTN